MAKTDNSRYIIETVPLETYEKIRTGGADFSVKRRALADHYPWGGEYRPLTWGEVAFVPERGFLVQLTCVEAAPRTVWKNPQDPVYRDSCMEFFVNFRPEQPECGYLNFETNASSAMLCGYGKGRQERQAVPYFNYPDMDIRTDIREDRWSVRYLIPLSLIDDYYGPGEFGPGSELRGNFYKCGDDTPIPHYGCWSVIVSGKPDFHRPECFGSLIIE